MSKLKSEGRTFTDDLLKFDKTAIAVYDSFAEADEADRQYWLSRSPTERMIALEHIRQAAWGYDESTELKLQGSAEFLQPTSRPLSAGRRACG